mgnify:CR=1 FL=1
MVDHCRHDSDGGADGFQFAASPESFINRAAGLGEGTQIQAGGGKIRPPAVFSFTSGAVYYASASAAFLLHAMLAKLPYKAWLLYGAGAGLIVSLGVSGSRSAVLAVLVVVASLGVILLVRPNLVNRFGRHLLLGAVVFWAVSYLPIFREGVGILSDRFTESAGRGFGGRRPRRTDGRWIHRGVARPQPSSVRRLRAWRGY